jgi:hypothetical protein
LPCRRAKHQKSVPDLIALVLGKPSGDTAAALADNRAEVIAGLSVAGATFPAARQKQVRVLRVPAG